VLIPALIPVLIMVLITVLITLVTVLGTAPITVLMGTELVMAGTELAVTVVITVQAMVGMVGMVLVMRRNTAAEATLQNNRPWQFSPFSTLPAMTTSSTLPMV
jgi:hypothetical protein